MKTFLNKKTVAEKIDAAETIAPEQVTTDSFNDNTADCLNSLNNYDNDIFVPTPFRLLRKLSRVDRTLKVYLDKFIKAHPEQFPNYKKNKDLPVDFNHNQSLIRLAIDQGKAVRVTEDELKQLQAEADRKEKAEKLHDQLGPETMEHLT